MNYIQCAFTLPKYDANSDFQILIYYIVEPSGIKIKSVGQPINEFIITHTELVVFAMS